MAESEGLNEREAEVNAEIQEQAEQTPDDPETRREELELELMDEDQSDEGAGIGDHVE